MDKIVKTKHEKGKGGEALVKKVLRQRGYRIADVSRLPLGCDLVVEEKYRVEVKTTTRPNSFTATLYPERFDVLCFVVLSDIKNTVHFIPKKKLAMFKSSTLPNDYYFKASDLMESFTKKPNEVFEKINTD